MCDCFHVAFPNWHAASETGGSRRLRGPEHDTEDDSVCDEPCKLTEGERPRPQGSSPVDEYPDIEKYTDRDKEFEAEHDPNRKSGSGKKTKKSGIGSMFEKRSTPKMSKLKEVHSPENVIVKTTKDGCAEGLVYGGGGKEGIFIKEVVPESPASKSLGLKEGDQVLSATVYFDDMSYEDAIQILDHAQAYKVKLCLKRKPDITETEPVIESDIIPEETLVAPEMREQGKTKRRGDARISWPKFPSFGKGRKSRFIRSHSSSEADEQRKLELSPPTSDTESPIKSQDALKGKKRQKMKFSSLKKSGRISPSEEQCLKSPSGETTEVYETEEPKVVEDSSVDQKDEKPTEPQAVQHKVELITITESTLKTTDLTVALEDKESPSGMKSPDGKKKKKERAEFKIKILGKDKSHKKDAKAKPSPKRLKTLGASVDTADQPENKKSDATQSSESHDILQGDQLKIDPSTEMIGQVISTESVTSQKIEEKMKKAKEMKQNEETITGPTFKLPKIGFGDIATDETMQKINANVDDSTINIELRTTEGTEMKDAYEQLSSRAQLPKREEIEIPGMEDISMRTTTKGLKDPKAGLMRQYEEPQAETVQLSIDVDSVKEAVSKLPGYKLPEVDTSGVPIPQEITVIDANAQRISVKTPTKVVGSKTKHETQYISKTTMKLPQIPPGDSTSEGLSVETKVDLKTTETKHRSKVYKREDIVIPGIESEQEVTALQESDRKTKKSKIKTFGFGITKPDVKIPHLGINLPKRNISEQIDGTLKGEGTIVIQDVETGIRKDKGQIGGVVSDVKIPEIDGIEYIDSVGGSLAEKDGAILLTGFGVHTDDAQTNTDIYIPEIKGEAKDIDAKERTMKLPKFEEATTDIGVNVSHADEGTNIDRTKVKKTEREGKGSKFKLPHIDISMPKVKGLKVDLAMSKKDVSVALPEGKAEVKLPEVPEVDITSGKKDTSFTKGMMEDEKPELEIKPLQTDGELDGQGSKLKTGKLGLTMPMLSFSKKDGDVPEVTSNIKIPQEPNISVDMKRPESQADIDVQGGKFKRPKFGISLPKFKGPEFEISSSKKDAEVTLPEAKTERPDVEHIEPSIKTDVKAQEIAVHRQDVEESLSGFKLPKFKLPKFGIMSPNVSVNVPDRDKEVTMGGAYINIPEKGFSVNIEAPSVDFQGSSLGMKGPEQEGKGTKFEMPHFDLSLPKIKAPELHFSSQKRDIDVTLPQTKEEVKFADGPKVDVSLGNVEDFIPEAKAEYEKPELENKPLHAEVDGQGTKFKMPTFEMTIPKGQGPELHLGFSRKDVDVSLPEAKAEVKVPDVELKQPSAEIEMKAPGIKVETESTEGSPSKFKMPTFKLPKFGFGTRKASVEMPDMDTDVKTDGGDIKIPEKTLRLDIAAPTIETEGPSIHMKTADEGKGMKFKMPSLSFSGPQVKRPEIDLSLSKKDVDVCLPEAKFEVKVPDVELKQPSAEIELKAPWINFETESSEGSPSEFKVPTLKLPKFGISIPSASVEMPDMDKDVKIDRGDIKVPEETLRVDIAAPSIEIEGPSIHMKTADEGKGIKFKMPSLSFSGPKVKRPEIDLSLSKKDVDVSLPEAKAEVKVPDVQLTESSAELELKAPEIKVATKSTEGSTSTFKMPTFKLPKFGIGTRKASIEMPDMEKDVKIDGGDIKISEETLTVDIAAPSIEMEGPSIHVKTKGTADEGKGMKFKMPSLSFSGPQVKRPEIDLSLSEKDVDVSLPEVKVPDVQLKQPSAEIELKAPWINFGTESSEGSPSEFKVPTLKLPKFGISIPSASVEIPDMDKDVKIDGGAIKVPEEALRLDIAAPGIEMEGPSIHMKTKGTEDDGKGMKFKMPSLSFSGPKVKRPEIDLSLSKKDVDVSLPEAKAEVKVPDVQLTESSAELELKAPEIKVATKSTEGSTSTFKMPTFKLPKFGIGTRKASIEMPDMEKDVKIDGGDIKISEETLTVDIAAPSIEMEGPSIHMKTKGTSDEGKGMKFKMPSLSFSGPQVKRPEIDLSLSEKDVDVSLPEVKVPDVQLKQPSAEIELKAPWINFETESSEGSPSEFKVPTLKLPKFGISIPSASVEIPDMDKDVKIDGGDIKVPEETLRLDIAAPSIEMEGPSIHMKTKGTEDDGKGMKFKMPSLSFSGPKVKRPEIDLSLSKKDVDVSLPEAKAEVKVPDVELKQPSAEVEIKAPEIKVATKSTDGSPSKFKMPTFKLPKFGVGTRKTSVEMPDMDKDVKIDGADIEITEKTLRLDIAVPSIETEGPSIHMKTADEGKGMKFKMPSLSFSGPQVKRPEIDLSLSKKDVDVSLPEANAEVKVPDVELKQPSAEIEMKAPWINFETESREGSPLKFKVPTLKLPKFGIRIPSASVEMPDMDKDVKIDGVDIKVAEETLRLDIAAPGIEMEGPSIHMKTKGTEDDRKGMKFKMPSLSFSGPKVKRPEIDLTLSKKDVDVSLPEAKVEVKVPDVELKQPSAEIEIKAPGINVETKNAEGSPSKFKMPTFKLPTFGVGTRSASVEMPHMDRDVKIDGRDIEIPEETLRVDIAAPNIETEGPSIHVKTKGTEDEGKGMKFKMPSLSFSGPKVKRPEIDLSLSKKDVDVSLPEAKVPDVQLKQPSAKIEIKAPEIKVATKNTEGSPSKFKMPTFKLPTFGVGTASASVEMPDMDKDVKIDGADVKIPEETLRVDIAAPSIETEGPSIHMKTKGTEDEGKGMKFKMPSLRFSAPHVKGPEIDLTLSKKDVDVSLPEANAEVKVPDVELKQPSAEIEMKAPWINFEKESREGSPLKFKVPTLKLPKFGISIPSASVEMPDMDKDVKIDGVDIKVAEETLRLDIAAPGIEMEGPSIHMKTKGTADDRKGMKFKMPSLSFSGPKVKRPEIDLTLSKKDVDVSLPEAKVEVKVTDVELKQPSAEIEIKAPGINVETKNAEGSPSKFKMPTFKLPTFGVGTRSASVEMPHMDKDVKIDGRDIEIPEETLRVDIAAPNIETEGPSIHMKTKGTEDDGKGMKFKMPSLSFSGPKVKRPEIDLSLSKKDVDVSLPEAKAEVKVPDVELKQPSAKIEIKAPEIKVAIKNTEGSPSKFKMPTFKLPTFGVGTASATVEMPDMDKDVKIDGADIKIPEETLRVDIAAPSIETEGPSIHMKTKGTEDEGKGMKFKMPSLRFSAPHVKGPEIDLSLSKKDVDVSLPEAKAEVKVPDVELKQPSAEIKIKAPEIKAATKSTEVSPSKFKLPKFKLPAFGVGTASATVEMPDMDKDVKTDGGDIKFPEEVLRVEIAAPSIETEGPSIQMKTTGTTDEGKGMKFKMPSLSFSGPKVKLPEIDSSVSKEAVDLTIPAVEAEVKLPNVKVKEPQGTISEPDVPTVEVEAKLKRPNWTFPKFSLSRTSDKVPDVDLNLDTPKVDVTSPEVKRDLCLADVEVQVSSEGVSTKEPSAVELDANLKKSKFSLPKFSFSKSNVKGPEVSAELPRVDVSLSEGEVIVKQPGMEIHAPDLEAKHDGQGTKFTLPKFNFAQSKAKGQDEDLKVSQKDVDITLPGIKAEVNAKGPSVDINMDESREVLTGTEMSKSETVSLESQSKFKLPSFKMPKLSISRPKSEDVDAPVETEYKQDRPELEVEQQERSKSPTMTLTSFGEIFKGFDGELGVTETDKEEDILEPSRQIHDTDEKSGIQSEPKERETSSKQDITKSPERTGWFKFPRFGLSSPSEPAKTSERGDTVAEETSPTCSVQSSDAFADVSSTMTSEYVGPSLSSPTKVTVKYSDPNAARGLEEMHSNVISTSTTRTQVISVEPNLPEKITVLSSGVSSSSEDTVRLEPGQINVFRSNIQVTAEANLPSAAQILSTGGLRPKSGADETESWTVEESQGGKRTIYQRQSVRETSSEASESRKTIVITKQITHIGHFDSSEPISGETASSIQRLRDSMHSDKMRFFDSDKK